MNYIHIQHATRLSLLVIAIASPLLAMAEESETVETLTYTITDTRIEGGAAGNPPNRTYVTQRGRQAVARTGPEPDAPIAIISDPDGGVRSAGPNPGGGFPVLRAQIDGLPSLKVGDQIHFGYQNPGAVEEVTYVLERGDRDRDLHGRPAIHSILSIELRVSLPESDGMTPTEVHGVGRADLWTVPDLPFSWVPYTSNPSFYAKAAIPLSTTNPRLAAFLLDHFSERLTELGLLVRAEVTSEITSHYDGEPGTRSSSEMVELVIGDLETGVDVQAYEPPSQAVLTKSRSDLIMAVLYTVYDSGCGDAVSGSRLSLAADSAGHGAIAGEGEALPVRKGEKVVLALRSPVDPDVSNPVFDCALVVLPDGEPEVGEYQIFASKPDESAESANKAVAVFMTVEGEELRSFAAVETGVLALSHEGDEFHGELNGSGFRLAFPDQESSVLYEDVDVRLRFAVIQ